MNLQHLSWADFKSEADGQLGTEHLVEFRDDLGLVVKITLPPKFGLVPKVLSHPVPNLRGEPGTRKAIEYVPATPLEYLQRWIAANHIFSDQVRLTAVIQWADGNVSFAITQPQYHGEPAETRDIERHFKAAGWTPINDPTGQHSMIYNYVFQTLAIDAPPRHCYINAEEGLRPPFDVILGEPDDEMKASLKL